MNAIALTMDDIEAALTEAINDQYIGTVNIGQVDWVYKIQYPDSISSNVQHTVVDNGTSVPVVSTLREFYASTNACIFDFDKHTIYFRVKPTSVVVDTMVPITDVANHHVWNSIDELALELGLSRRSLETNEELKARIMNVFRYKGSSTADGIIFGLSGQLGFIKSQQWLSTDATCTVQSDAYPSSLMVAGRVCKDGEYSITESGIVINRRINIVGDDAVLTGCTKRSGNITLSPNLSYGSVLIPAFTLPHLQKWDRMIMYDGNGIEITDGQRHANSNQTRVSSASLSASLILLMKWAEYRRLRHASAILAHTDREDRRI
jgi:hypothetical protein